MTASPAILQQFESIDLAEMERVKLMNRTDSKFTFTVSQFDLIMKEISSNYRVLEVNGKKFNRYKTLYYDTAGLDLYAEHHNGKLNRYKIRHRTYVESNTGFLEVKFKNNKGRTIKTRVNENEVPMTWKGDSEFFLVKTLPFSPTILKPVLWVNYSRCTLVHKTEAERLTIDTDLEFIKGDVSKQLTGLIIAEVKQDKKKQSPFLKMMKKYHIREGSISKYCMGIALTCGEVKKNNFKRKLLAIQNMIHYDNPANN